MRFFSFSVLSKRIVAIKAMMKDKTVSIWKKLLIILGILYVICPIDLFPIATFPLSMVDDIGVWIFIIFALRHTLDSYWFGGKVVDFSKKYNDKNIVEGVEFNVDDASEDNETNDDEKE